MRRWTIGLIIFISLMMTGSFLTALFNNFFPDYARITEVDYEASVIDEKGSHGKVHIKERLTFDVHAASHDNLFWELWRELPEAYYDGVKVDYKVLSVKEILEDGTEIVMPESSKLYWDDSDFIDTTGLYGPGKWYHSEGPYDNYYNYESLIFYVDGLYRETITYEIEYEMYNAALRYADASELYLGMYSGPTSKYLKSFNGAIKIPLDKMPREGNYKAYTYGTDSHEFEFKTSTTQNPGFFTFSFSLNEDDLKFHSYNDYIEFSLITFNEDKHIFTENASINYYYNSNVLDEINAQQESYEKLPAQYYEKKSNLFRFLSFLSALLIAITILGEKFFKRSLSLFTPTQKIDFFRDIPSDADPSFIRQLVFNDNKDVIGQDGFASVLLSLIHKNLIELELKEGATTQTPSNTVIKINPNNLMSLSPIEKHYFDLIARHSKDEKILLKELQEKIGKDYSYTDAFIKRVESSINQYGVSNNYYQILNYKKPKNTVKRIGIFLLVFGILVTIVGNLSIYETRYDFAFGAFFILGLSFLITSLYLIVNSKKYLLFTQFGVDEREKWHALYKFLNDETLMIERGVKDLVIWEKYLIYATAFGISDKVIKAFKLVFPKNIIESSPVYYHTRLASNNSIINYSKSLSTSARAASFSSLSGGHGGYGGGGRGGGGGGGGH